MQHSTKHLLHKTGLAETHHATARSYCLIPEHGYSPFHNMVLAHSPGSCMLQHSAVREGSQETKQKTWGPWGSGNVINKSEDSERQTPLQLPEISSKEDAGCDFQLPPSHMCPLSSPGHFFKFICLEVFCSRGL